MMHRTKVKRRSKGSDVISDRYFIRGWISFLLVFSVFWSGCAFPHSPTTRTVQVVLEEGEGYVVSERVYTLPAGRDLVILVFPVEGWRIKGCDYPGALLEEAKDGGIRITLPNLRYTTMVSVLTEKNPFIIRYHLGKDGKGSDPVREISYPAAHLRVNTASGSDGISLISDDRQKILCGWNTRPDGNGLRIGLGSRVSVKEGVPLDLYGDWLEAAPAEDFIRETNPAGEVVITGYKGNDKEIVVPPYLDERPVAVIGQKAFFGVKCQSIILPPTVREVELYAFAESTMEHFSFFDTLTTITDYSVQNCGTLKRIQIHAVRPPVYSGTYFDTFTDKMDRLRALKERKKIVLFSGSSTRFGYDSKAVDEAFPSMDVVNMGVFAYTNALPQFDLIKCFMGGGDVLVHAPEFDAKNRQFAVTDAMDESFFCLIESDYDLLDLLDFQDYTAVLSAFSSFQKIRLGMEAGDYLWSASDFDEDHRPVSVPSYNEYGDYILFRPNAADDEPVYDLPVDYFPEAFPEERLIDPLNKVYQGFLAKGIRVFFTYAPRNRKALSEESTPERRRQLDVWLRETLCVPVITDIEDSLFQGRYLYGTDNHLSTEGVRIRTARIIRELQKAGLESS